MARKGASGLEQGRQFALLLERHDAPEAPVIAAARELPLNPDAAKQTRSEEGSQEPCGPL